MRGVAIVLAVAACNTPRPQLQLKLTEGPSQACPSADCAEVPMRCETVMSIQIGAPEDMSSPYLSQCVYVPFDRRRDICSLAGVDLSPTPLPVRDLEVQVAVYPATAVVDPDTDELHCPSRVVYGAGTGFPVEQAPAPALGGHAFYHPGDDIVTVELGCTDLAAIEESCVKDNMVMVTVGVDEFDTRLPVGSGSSSVAARLLVSVGEPRMQEGAYVFNVPDGQYLQQVGNGGNATWGGEVTLQLNKFACVSVLDEDGQTPAVLRCKTATQGQPLQLRGTWISPDTVNKILRALSGSSSTTLPAAGLTIGLVVDPGLRLVSGATVKAGTARVMYLTDTGTFTATSTSSSGVFVSTDAVFGTQFSTGSGRTSNIGIGGLVSGKISVVMLTTGDAVSDQASADR